METNNAGPTGEIGLAPGDSVTIDHDGAHHVGKTRVTATARDVAVAEASLSAARQRERLLADVDNRFIYHPPKEDQLPRYAALRSQARELAAAIVADTPASREQSLALTHLETAIFFANAAIARNE